MEKDLTEIKNYLLNNDKERRKVINEINCFNGDLQFLNFYDNDEYTLNGLFSSPSEAIRSAYFGNYDFNKPFIRLDGCGNLESLDEYEIREEEKEYIDDIVDQLEEVWGMLPELSEELTQLLVDLNKED